jgi:hypothetical protein
VEPLQDFQLKIILTHNAYRNLYRRTIDIALEKIRKRKKIIDDKARILTTQTDEYVYVIDGFFYIIDKVLEVCEPNYSDLTEVFEFKMQLCRFIGAEINKLFTADECKHLQIQRNNLQCSEKIRKYFK